MQYLLQLLISGLAIGAIYGLIAMGFAVIYKSTGLVNFAQGEMTMVVAYVAWTISTTVSGNVFVVALARRHLRGDRARSCHRARRDAADAGRAVVRHRDGDDRAGGDPALFDQLHLGCLPPRPRYRRRLRHYPHRQH